MKQTDGAKKQLELLLQRYPILAGQRDEIDGAYQIIAASYEAGGKLLIAGNGGSAADAEHIVGELMKGFKKTRRLDEALAERLLQESPELGDSHLDDPRGFDRHLFDDVLMKLGGGQD